MIDFRNVVPISHISRPHSLMSRDKASLDLESVTAESVEAERRRLSHDTACDLDNISRHREALYCIAGKLILQLCRPDKSVLRSTGIVKSGSSSRSLLR